MEIKASSSLIRKEAADLSESLDRIPAAVKDLESALSRLAACWDGPSRIEFQNQTAADIREMSRLHGDLVQYVRMTDKAGRNYLMTEGTIRDKIRLLF